MTCRPYVLAGSVLMLASAVGCVDSATVGLSNAQSHVWRNDHADRSHDAVADGDDSCERPGSNRPDPAPLRLNPCPSDEPMMVRTVATR